MINLLKKKNSVLTHNSFRSYRQTPSVGNVEVEKIYLVWNAMSNDSLHSEADFISYPNGKYFAIPMTCDVRCRKFDYRLACPR